jgi:ribosome biogenesis GTPase
LEALGWDDDVAASYRALGGGGRAGRVSRLDRGWSTVLVDADGGGAVRVRNIGADVAVGDWVVVSDDGERIEHVLARRSAFVRRASFEGSRAEAHTLAANIDVVLLLHALTSPPNPRRLERELVLAYDSGAQPAIVLTKLDLVDGPERATVVAAVDAVAGDLAVHAVSSRTGDGLDALRAYGGPGRTVALLGASGVGKSTLVNALVGHEVQRTGDVREGDDRGRHTTVAVELIRLPTGGWLIDTPGLRAVSLWSSGHGIERAFADIFDLSEHCRFRDCKHEDEPGCAVQAAIAEGTLDPRRLDSMKRLVAEEAALEEEQWARDKAADKRGRRKPRPTP